jgi:mono/diheme cytochrome c family protein
MLALALVAVCIPVPVRGGAQRPAFAQAPRSAALDDAALYRERCATCHGAEGRGDGPAAGLLSPRPRDFTRGRYKFRSTPTGTPPSVEDIARTIRLGSPGTSMPGYADLLGPEQIGRLARHVLAFAPEPAGSARRGVGQSPASPPAVAQSGQALYATAGCGQCHGADGRGSGWSPRREGPGGERAPTDLTEPWTFRGGSDEASIALRILTGIDGSAMPAYADSLSLAQAREIARHVRALGRTPIWEERDPARVATAGVAVAPLDRGRYLVNAMQCPLCHTPIDAETGAYDTAYFLAGGMRVSAYPWGVWYSRNLTPDESTGLGRWSEAEIADAITRGLSRDGRRLDPMAMPWPWFSRLTAADAQTIAAYLKALPPVSNAVPGPRRLSIGERAGGALLVLLGAEAAVEFWGGNAAAGPFDRSIPVSTGRRLGAQVAGWSMAGLAAGLLALGICRRRRWMLVGGVALALGWAVLGAWPPFALLSPAMTTRWLFLGAPALPASMTGAERALAERGEYLATIAPCGLCHTPASAFAGFLTGRTLAGGMEARWRVYGRAVSTNLTRHQRDGIGGVDDTRLLRAMRSGIGADGRRLHWQAMPWDITSNWSEEDLRAMLAYFRALPPVPGRAPAPRPPRPDDPSADTFAFGDAIRRAP